MAALHADARLVEPPPSRQAQQETDQASGVLLNDDPSQAGGEDGKPMKLIAIVNPLTIVVPDGRGIPRSFDVGGRLPNCTVLRSVDPKQGCAITDRGQLLLGICFFTLIVRERCHAMAFAAEIGEFGQIELIAMVRVP